MGERECFEKEEDWNEIVRDRIAERERRVWREEVEKRPKLREVYVEERTILRRETTVWTVRVDEVERRNE